MMKDDEHCWAQGGHVRLRDQLKTPLSGMLVLAMVAVTAGCVSVPTSRSRTDMAKVASEIRTVGLVRPDIPIFQEVPRFGLNKVIHSSDWSSEADEVVTKAFSEAMGIRGWKVVMLAADDRELRELTELYSAVEYSIYMHAWGEGAEGSPRWEPFPEQIRALHYSLGPVRDLMERQQVDAIWFVRGFNLLPTAGAWAKEGAEILLGVIAALGGHPSPVVTLRKIELRTGLVDRSGSVLYFGLADDNTGAPNAEHAGRPVQARSEVEPVPPDDVTRIASDLRDLRAARYFIRAALSGLPLEAGP